MAIQRPPAWAVGAVLAAVLLVATAGPIAAEEPANQIELCPLVDVWILQYARSLSAQDQLVTGVIYTNPEILGMLDYPGTIQTYTVEAGYRRFLLAGLNAEVNVLAGYVVSYDETEARDYNGFALSTEVRAGYQFDFRLFSIEWFANVQWFAGYKWINPVSQSFVEVDGGHYYISPIPIILLGAKF